MTDHWILRRNNFIGLLNLYIKRVIRNEKGPYARDNRNGKHKQMQYIVIIKAAKSIAYHRYLLKKEMRTSRAEEMDEYKSKLGPRTCVKWLTAAYTSSSWHPAPSSGLHGHMHLDAHAHTGLHIIEKKKK